MPGAGWIALRTYANPHKRVLYSDRRCAAGQTIRGSGGEQGMQRNPILELTQMKAIEITEFGAPDVLKLAERPTPQPKAGEVLIKVAASGINRPDVFQRKGGYAPPPGASDLPGLEVAGEIVGGDIDGKNNPFGLKIGDRVCALLAGGGYAEYAVAPLLQCLPVPGGLSDVEAASLPETFFTV